MRLFPRADGYEAEKISNRGDLHMFRVVYDSSKRRSSAIIKDTGTMENLMGGDGPITKLWSLYDETMESLEHKYSPMVQKRLEELDNILQSRTEETELKISLSGRSKSFWIIDRRRLNWNRHTKEIHFCLSRTVKKKKDDNHQLFRMELLIDAPYHDQLELAAERPEQIEETKYDEESGSMIIKEEPITPPVTLLDNSSLDGTLKRRHSEAISIDTEIEKSKKPMLSTSNSSWTPSDIIAPPSLLNTADDVNPILNPKSPPSP
jgi:hypothetical protein